MPLMPKLKPRKKIRSIEDLRKASKEMDENPAEEAMESKKEEKMEDTVAKKKKA